MRVIFTLASGRSGTRFLAGLFRNNAACVCRHEPYFDWGNPNLFGRAIYDRTVGNLEAVRRQVARKKAWIERTGASLYVETSHAFLKSWGDLASETFADWKLVHLIRDPRKVARSEANRHRAADRWRLPFCYYRAGSERFFRWALTGREPIFGRFAPGELSLFQWYVVQWIEIENRAMQILDRFDKHDDCVTLHTPRGLNDPQCVARMFEDLGVSIRACPPRLVGNINRTPRSPTVVTAEDEQEFAAVIARLRREHLAIFQREPYACLPWRHILSPQGVPSSPQNDASCSSSLTLPSVNLGPRDRA